MKKKPTRNRRGRKKFSVGKQLSPTNSLDENLALAAMGEFALTQQRRKIFSLAALWKTRYASLFKDNPAESEGAARIRQKRRERVVSELLHIISPALENLDAKPFKDFMDAIALAKNLNLNGALLRDTHEVLRVAEEMELTLGESVVQTVSPKDFKSKLRWPIADKQFTRIKKVIGLHWPTGRPPKA